MPSDTHTDEELRERVVSDAYTLDRFMEGRLDGMQFVTYTTDDLIDLIKREKLALIDRLREHRVCTNCGRRDDESRSGDWSSGTLTG